MKKNSFNRNDLESFANNDIGFCGLDLSRISSTFIVQVIQMQNNQVINTHQMMDEVKYLEGVREKTSTKKVDVFKRLPLKGLKKTHFTDARFIVKNIGIHFGLDKGGNKKLDELIKRAFGDNTSGIVDNEMIMQIANGMSFGALQERSGNSKITGEWIIFQEFKNKNYYLTLASHNENDYEIYKRICDVYKVDFPFLV